MDFGGTGLGVIDLRQVREIVSRRLPRNGFLVEESGEMDNAVILLVHGHSRARTNRIDEGSEVLGDLRSPITCSRVPTLTGGRPRPAFPGR